MSDARLVNCGVIRNFPLTPYFFVEFDDLVHIEEFATHFVDWLKSRAGSVTETPGPETIYTGFTRIVRSGNRAFHIHSARDPDRSAIVEWDVPAADQDDTRRLMKDYARALKRTGALPSASPR